MSTDGTNGVFHTRTNAHISEEAARTTGQLMAERQRVFRQNGPDENPEPLPTLPTSVDTIYDDDFDGSSN